MSWSFKNQYSYEVLFFCLKKGHLVMVVRLNIRGNVRTVAMLFLQNLKQNRVKMVYF
jgi:hypothetical protein